MILESSSSCFFFFPSFIHGNPWSTFESPPYQSPSVLKSELISQLKNDFTFILNVLKIKIILKYIKSHILYNEAFVTTRGLGVTITAYSSLWTSPDSRRGTNQAINYHFGTYLPFSVSFIRSSLLFYLSLFSLLSEEKHIMHPN